MSWPLSTALVTLCILPSSFLHAFLSSTVGRTNTFINQLPLKDEPTSIDPNRPHFEDFISRRDAARRIIATSLVPMILLPQPAVAGKPEIDTKSGQLFAPKGEMLGGGGTDMTRGIKLQSREGSMSTAMFTGGTKANGLLQTVYNTRFITYLARFLLNFDQGAVSWWDEQDFMGLDHNNKKQFKFGEFAESVEIGLVDYFLGPYGSYDQAVKAGLLASDRKEDVTTTSTFRSLLDGLKPPRTSSTNINQSMGPRKKTRLNLAKQGVLNLFTLLKARYSSVNAKKQLVILFSLITDPTLQPTDEIRGLLGEIDDASVEKIDITGLSATEDNNVRLSSKHGGGYDKDSLPLITIEPPPALGDQYHVAKLEPVIKCTTRVLRIVVTDGGEGYTNVPTVQVIQDGVKIVCDACPIMGRNGTVESIIVLNPGLGYGGYGLDPEPPQVVISQPSQTNWKRGRKLFNRRRRAAKAYAKLEYSISGIKVVDGGNGYVLTEPPKVFVSKPHDDPDWYVSPVEQKFWTMDERDFLFVNVSTLQSTTIIDDIDVTGDMQMLLSSNPLAMFPSTVRPTCEFVDETKRLYKLQNLAPPPPYIMLPSSRFRAYDPIFGAISNKPVTKSARSLTTGEYSRLALSGAVCTVLVRTALNPLELVKTKIQLKNDDDLMNLVSQRQRFREISTNNTRNDDVVMEGVASSANIGTFDVILTLIDKRGLQSLFQSADITFLASLVFGSFGFGATELFRRSFSLIFFPDDSGSSQKGDKEIFLLIAAASASIITSFFAAPFETLRVRSMGYPEPKTLNYVFSDYLREKRMQRQSLIENTETSTSNSPVEFHFSDLRKDDLGPFFSSFFAIVSRELPFAVAKFLAFDIVASVIVAAINFQSLADEPVEVGVGATGLVISAFSGAIAGLAGALVSHPADLILTLTSAAKNKVSVEKENETITDRSWKFILDDLLQKPGSVLNLFVGLPARSAFFFMVIGLQFFLYDYLKGVFRVGSDDLTLVLDVFYAVRKGLNQD